MPLWLWPRRARRRLLARWSAVPLRTRLVLTGTAGTLGAAAVGYLASLNPYATPQGIAVPGRVAIIGTLIAAGLYAQTSRFHARMGGPLIGAGFFSMLWLLNGSQESLAFSIGMLCAGLAPIVFCTVMLIHPAGRLVRAGERRVVLIVGAVNAAVWLALVLISPTPPWSAALMRCGQHCPSNVFFTGLRAPVVEAILKSALIFTWLGITFWTTRVLVSRWRRASAASRVGLSPIVAVAVINPLLLVSYLVLLIVTGPAADGSGTAYVASSLLIPLAILFALSRERLYLGAALAEFVAALAQMPETDPQGLLAAMLGDSSLEIAYRRPKRSSYLTFAGLLVSPEGSDRAVSWIERMGAPVAAVSYSPELSDQGQFVQAAGAAAVMHLERAQLAADLRASTEELTQSRIRLLEAAHEERRRIERDLHDGVQQQLVALRMRLGMAAEAIRESPERGAPMLSAVENQIDEVLETLRNLARGIYPALLHDRGLAAALKAAGQRVSVPVTVRSDGTGRYPEDIEVAVYFCCLEALQNIIKHCAEPARAAIRLWEEETGLCFEVSDAGPGFDLDAVREGCGLTNMRDRISTLGGTLTIQSSQGTRTVIAGRIPTPPRSARP